MTPRLTAVRSALEGPGTHMAQEGPGFQEGCEGMAMELVLETWRTGQMLVRRLDRRLAARGVTFAQYQLLQAIAQGRPGSSSAELARGLGLHPTTVGAALRRLEGRGLVQRQIDPRDRRATHVALSESGSQMVEDLSRDLRTIDLSSLGLSREVREQLRQILAAIAEKLEMSPVRPTRRFKGVRKCP